MRFTIQLVASYGDVISESNPIVIDDDNVKDALIEWLESEDPIIYSTDIIKFKEQ